MPGFWELEQIPSVACYILHTDVTTLKWSLGLRNLQPYGMPIQPVAGMPYDHARNSGVQACLNTGAKWVFSLDSDVVPPADAILRLMSYDLPVISGVYYRRSPPEGLPVMIKNGWWYTNAPKNSIVEVDVVGAGCLLVRRDVFEKLPPIDPNRGKRWFDWRVDMAHLLPPGEAMSEDFSFNLHCRRHGIRIMVDTGVICSHVGHGEAGENSFRPLVTM